MVYLSQLWGASLMIGPIFVLLFTISSSSFVLGLTKYNDCPFQTLLPQSLVTFGVLGVLCSIFLLLFMIILVFKVDDSGNHLWYLLYILVVPAIYGISTILLAFAFRLCLVYAHNLLTISLQRKLTLSYFYSVHFKFKRFLFPLAQHEVILKSLSLSLHRWRLYSIENTAIVMHKEKTTTTTAPTSTLTPPIRSIAAEASADDTHSIVLEKTSLRPRSSNSSLNTDSLSSFSIRHFGDDESSNDDATENWAHFRDQLDRLGGRLVPLDSLSLSATAPVVVLPVAQCEVCLEESPIRPTSCCSSSICSLCIYTYLCSHINEARIRITCPVCPHILTREEILSILAEKSEGEEVAERYKRFYADINRESHIKTCPHCCAIKVVEKNLCEGRHWRKTIPRRVTCEECQFIWCFYCHAPWHEKMTCKEYREGEKMLRTWAGQTDNNQQNAQRCPRCKVFISRNGGCPHMVCSKCHCDFCYNCGKKRIGMKFLGSHESRLSPFGCKYNLYPDKPILRHTVRGLVAGAATLAAPVAAVGAVALLAVATTIGAPTYGTYRLVRHIRNKRRAHRPRFTETPVDTADPDDDDFDRAVAESLQSFIEEKEKREQQSKEDFDDEDDDSFDD